MTVDYKNHVHPSSHWLQQIFSWPKGPVKYILVVKMAIIIYWKLPIFQAWNTFVKKSKVFNFFEYFLRFNFENFLRFDTTSSMIVYHFGNVEFTAVIIICQVTIRWKKTTPSSDNITTQVTHYIKPDTMKRQCRSMALGIWLKKRRLIVLCYRLLKIQ